MTFISFFNTKIASTGDLGSLRFGGSLVLFTIAFCQAHTHGQRLPGHLCTACSAGLAARQRHPGPHHVACPPPLHAQALAWGPLAALRLHQASNPRRRPLAATQPPTRAHARSLPQAPRTTSMAHFSYRNSTAFIWHSSGGRCPPQRPPALKTSRPSSPRSPSSLPGAVSRSSSPSIGRPSRSCVSGTPARRLEEQRQLHLPQKHKATVPDSTLRVEMNNLEEQADNAKARELFWKPLSWLANRPTSANDAFDPALWETFVSTTLGLELPILAALPRLRLAHVPLLCQRA